LSFDISEWIRFEYNETPVYMRPDSTDWFVPDNAGDELLKGLKTDRHKPCDYRTLSFIERLPEKSEASYPGRSALLGQPEIRELWFHLTDRCNMACTHCLFSSAPTAKPELPTAEVLKLIKEAELNGCRVFALTGGEPFVHPGIEKIISAIMEIENSHAVILSNGLEAADFLKKHNFDPERLHLQISVDGIKATHDKIRGKGMFEGLQRNLAELRKIKTAFTLSMCVTRSNAEQMPEIVNFAAENGASNVHFMWYFIRGRGKEKEFIEPSEIMKYLLQAETLAARKGITIDNIEAVRSMIFAPCGTIHDGSSAGWKSVAIGPDGKIYPSAATVAVPELATPVIGDLLSSIKQSEVLGKIRNTTAKNLSDPFRLFFGGGDLDHSYMHSNCFCGADPYSELSKAIALELITRKAAMNPVKRSPALRLKMGDVLSSCSDHGAVALTHNNCLLAVAGNDSLNVVKDFYSRAAETANEDILNPVCYSEDVVAHIPENFRFRGYGCGSPVMDAEIKPGEYVVDLGSGRGIECFIAAKMTGEKGHVTGLDMLDPMLKIAEQGKNAVSKNLGYANIDFRKGYLEKMPFEEASVDLILSNCVLNLSTDKRSTFNEIFRVLKFGGRITVSDVVCETEPGPEIRNNDQLHGECIAGALTVKNLKGLLLESGFDNFHIIKRFPYREVGGHQFYSLTFSACKPELKDKVKIIYRGPFTNAETADGTIILPGEITEVPKQYARTLGDSAFIIDEHDNVTNVDIGSSCCCPTPQAFDGADTPDTLQVCCTPSEKAQAEILTSQQKQSSGCMVCGSDLKYTSEPVSMTCSYCNQDFETNAYCAEGHFVCDSCHSKDGLEVIKHMLLGSTETDLIELLIKIRKHPVIPVHGPEHHSLVPGIITAVYRNSGGSINDKAILTAVNRGTKVAGGYCGFMGICGAAMGVGIAVSTILEGTPYTAQARSFAQRGTWAALEDIAKMEAARCCQRDSWLALKACAEISEELLGIKLKSEVDIHCNQMKLNKECIGHECPVIKKSGS
jgi:MoaA/NifB/PqqE/SkfB family radical SAM enzyme/SAM-dependent methyltransferase